MFNPIKKQQLLFNCSHEIFAYLFVNRYDFMILSYKWMTLCWRNYEDINLTLSKAYINSDSTSNVSLTRTFKLSTVKYQWLLLPFNSILLDVYFSDLWFFMVMFCFVLFLILLVCFCFRCHHVRSWKRQTKGIIYLARVLNNIRCN
jgi:quinol-cytochrome oxidoreductase complex cytochrome b subunit